MLYGEQQIAEASLEAVPNPNPGRDYHIECLCPEFTTLCPRSGFPDFATIHIRYIPDQAIVELKSLKLYLNRYRDEHTFHEAAVNRHHVRDLHATILHLMGLDPLRLTYFYGGLEQKLTGVVEPEIIRGVLA